MTSYKGYKEMTRCVLAARDAHLEKKRRQQIFLMRCIPAMSGICAALILGLGFRAHVQKAPDIGNIPPTAAVTTESGASAAQSAAQTTALPEAKPSAAPDPADRTETIPQGSAEPAETGAEPLPVQSEVIPAQTDPAPEPAKTDASAPAKVPASDLPDDPTVIPDEVPAKDPDLHNYLHWDEMTVDQQYFMAETGEPPVSYHTAEQEVPAGEIGESVGPAYMSGYDWYAQIYYHCEAKAYQIKGDDTGRTIAIQFPDNAVYYLYAKDAQPQLEQPTG